MSERRHPVELPFLAQFALIVSIIGVIIALVIVALSGRPVFRFSQESYIPDQAGGLCPGDELTYRPVAIVRDYPIVVNVAEEWQDGNGDTLIPARSSASRQHNYDSDIDLTHVYSHTVPSALNRPGRYILNARASVIGTPNKIAILNISFDISPSCFAEVSP